MTTASERLGARPAPAPAERHARYEALFADLDPPFAFVDLDAMWHNSDETLRRAGAKTLRVASKSLRCRSILEAILDRDPRYQGVLSFTLPEALWLAGHGVRDLLVAYPTTDRTALRELGELTARDPDGAPIVMVDSTDHLDLIELATGGGVPIRVCLDFDASLWFAGGRVWLGARRSPVHTTEDAVALARAIVARPGFRLVAIMSYEGQIAGQGDEVPGNPLKTAAIKRFQRVSFGELRERRAAAIAAVREIADIELVNAGGTGDLHLVAGEPSITEATVGSAFYAPALFDRYSAFRLEPAAMFVLPVSRRPGRGVATVLGGGYIASGPAGRDRLPEPYLPAGLSLGVVEGAGEVQTPLHGGTARTLRVGDRVYFRHAKAGELCERFDRLLLLAGDRIVDEAPTYRGEGKAFL